MTLRVIPSISIGHSDAELAGLANHRAKGGAAGWMHIYSTRCETVWFGSNALLSEEQAVALSGTFVRTIRFGLETPKPKLELVKGGRHD